MHTTTRLQIKLNRLGHWVTLTLTLLGWLLPLAPAAASGTSPTAPAPSLAQALNPDGTLRPGTVGSFDAHLFTMRKAPDGRPVFRPAGTTGAGDEGWQDGFNLPYGANWPVNAVAVSGSSVYIGGAFSNVGATVAARVSRWNGTAWSALGLGVADGTVTALAVASNGDVLVGGTFTTVGGAPASRIARWNGTAWSALGAGLNGSVAALAIASTGDVYVGGSFTQAGGAAASNVAKWNGTAWSALGTGVANGVGSPVLALAISGTTLYVGGQFTTAGGVAASHIAHWNGTAWSALGAGVNGNVATMAVASNGDVYAGNNFIPTGGGTTANVAKWNGTAWSTLGAGMSSGSIYALTIAGNGDVYAGGSFSQAGGVSAASIAKWNGTAWSALGAGLSSGTAVYALALLGADVYVGGSFTRAGGNEATYAARWNGTAWSAVGNGIGNGLGDGSSNSINAVAVTANGDVYAGGSFTRAGAVPANGVAKWNGLAWSALGNGLGYGTVRALAIAANGEVYAGGNFTTTADGTTVNGVACWNGTTWSALGLGLGRGNSVAGSANALAIASNGDVYVGGFFTQAGNGSANNVAKWDGTAWSALGFGVYNSGSLSTVNALALAANGEVYVAGSFSQAGAVSAFSVAKWNGTAWSALGNGLNIGLNSTVNALAIASNGTVYVGGYFERAGGVLARLIAKWDGTVWSNVGALVNVSLESVDALAVASNGDVYAGGTFNQYTTVPTRCMARWNGTAWVPLGTGLNAPVRGLATGPMGKLYAVGQFTAVGDGSKLTVGFGVYDPLAPLATTTATPRAALTLYPNPTQGTAVLTLPATAQERPIWVLDATGREVRRQLLPAHTAAATLDLTGLAPGLYVVRCGATSGKLVVE